MAFTSSYGKRMLKASMQLQDTTTAKVRRKEIIGSDQYWCQSGLDQDGFSKQFINKYIGFGVFATKHFARGDFLLEYVGEHISLGEANKREKRRKSTRCYMYYYRHKEKTFCVDATKPSDRLCRLVNDERPKKCNAIMKLKIFSNEQYPRLCLYALRDITTGEEITYDYGDQENMEWRKKKKPDVDIEIEEESDDDPFDLYKDFNHDKDAVTESLTQRGMPEEYEDKMEQERRPVESDTDMLLLDTLPQEHEKSFEMHPANEPVFEPVLTSALLSSNQVKPQEMHCIDFSECNPDTQTEQNENLIKRAEIRNPIEYGTDVLLLEPLPQEQQKSLEMYPAIVPVFKQVLMPTPLSCKQVKPQEEHCTEVSESNPDTKMEENKSVMKMTETRNSKDFRCEDCEKSIAEFFCPQCLNAKAVFGIALCQPCSDALHKGATRRHHVLEDIKNTNKKLTLVDTIEDEKFSCEEDEDEYVPSKESEDEASDKNDDEIDVMEGQNIIEDSSDAESVEIPIQTVKSNEIKIQQPVKNENAKRANKYHSCPFCDNLFFKLPRHLEQKHFIEAEVRKALAFPKKSKERRKALLAIQNLGDYNHNCRVLLKGSGVVIPKYITKKGKQKFEKTNYIPCEFCLALYKKKELWKHHMHCPKRPADEKLKARKNPVSAGRMLLPSKSGSAEFNRDILNNMKKEDEVKEIIVSDNVIICFGERLYELHGHNQHHLNYISNRLRELGRLMVCVRSNDGNVSSVEEILNPHNFDLLIRSVKQIAGYSAEDGIYQIPSLPLRLGQSLEKCANILKCKAIENGLKDVIEKMDSFLALYDLDWTTRISSRAHATLNLGKFNRPQMLPLVEDVVQLHKYLDSRLLEVSKQDLSFREQYLRYCEIILAQVILFNRKRSGEAQRIRLKDFKVVEEETVDEQIVESLTPFERELCKSHKRVEIIGKKGGKVPVIFTNKMVMNIDKILQLRKELDIPNDFLFGRPDSKFPFRGCDCIRKFANQCGAKKPDLITSTQLRKQLATMCQVLGLTENNQDILAKFMGHDIRVHRDYYRLPDSVYQLGKVTKILHAINSGSVSEFAGKNFEDIEFSSKEWVWLLLQYLAYDYKSRKNIEAFVPLSYDGKRAIDVHVLIKFRNEVGIPVTNPYIFARLNADSPLNGNTKLKEIVTMCPGISYPEQIISRTLKKYFATVSQILDTNENEMEMLAIHLGHQESKSTKRIIDYRLSHPT